jgi:hypothetical protein
MKKTILITSLVLLIALAGTKIYAQPANTDPNCPCRTNTLTEKERQQLISNYQSQIGRSNLQKPAGFGNEGASRSSIDSKGTDFWLLFMKNYDALGSLYLDITSEANATGTVSCAGIGFSQNFSVTANTVTRVTVPTSAMIMSSATVESLGVHVVADVEVTVYGMSREQYTTDGFLGLPVDVLGTQYLAMTYPADYDYLLPEFAIVSPSDNNTITITPRELTFNGNAAGVPFNVILNQGQTYLVRGQASTSYSADLTGSIISSTSPVAFFSGHECADIPLGYGACDHLCEQIPPVSTWGETFVTRPLATRLNGDTWRFLASENGTQLTINGSNVATLNFGDFYETMLTGSSFVSANNPILAVQFSNGTQWDYVTSDPFMMVVPPYQQYLGTYIYSTPASGFVQNFFTSAVQTPGVGGMKLNGNPLNPGDYSAIGASGYSAAAFPVLINTSYKITNSSGYPSGLYLYGFDNADSYGYPGGQAFGAIASITALTISPHTGSAVVNTNRCWTAEVLDQFGAPVPGVRVDFVVTGVNPSSGFAFTNASGIATYCYTGTVIGQDIIVANVGALNDTAQFNWTSSAVPISNWALYLGIFLAVTFVIFRFRKMN